jgi:hypothetical protein
MYEQSFLRLQMRLTEEKTLITLQNDLLTIYLSRSAVYQHPQPTCNGVFLAARKLQEKELDQLTPMIVKLVFTDTQNI